MLSIAILLGCILAGLVIGTWRRYCIWRVGKSDSDQLSTLPVLQLFTIPKRYFVDLHHIVMRDKSTAYSHIFVAGSSIALCLLLLISLAINVTTIFVVQAIGVVLALLIAVGSVRLYLRRVGKPARLSYAAFRTMPWSLLVFGSGACGVLIFDRQWQWLSLALALVGGVDIFWSGVLNRPFKHIIAGCAHLAFHPRQDRFHQKPSTALRPLSISTSAETEQSAHGVATARDFTWRQILGFDACIQCGRCQEVCPAFAAGQPLNPKKLIQDCLLSAQGGDDRNYSGSHYPQLATNRSLESRVITGPQSDITPDFIASDTLFSCTTCRACVESCPMMIEHVDAIVDLRRHLTLDLGVVPNKGHEVLTNLRHTDTVSGNACANRNNWAVDLSIDYATADICYDVLLLSGEGGFDLRHQQVLRALVQLVQATDIRIAIMSDEPDCGDLARRLGDEIGFVRLANTLSARLQDLQFSRILTCDPHLYHAIQNEYPALGYSFPIVHHSEFLLEILCTEALPVHKLNRTITYHDPCYLGRYNGIFDAPRELLAHIGIHLTEMEKSAQQSRCCGWGGGAAFTDVAGQARIPDMRMQDVRETGAEYVAVACPNCRTMLDGVVDSQAQVVDLVELVHESVTKARELSTI